MSIAERIDTRPTDAAQEVSGYTKRRLASPAVWSMTGFAAAQAIRFGSSTIVARYLQPEDYGVMAIASSVVTASALFSDLGTHQLLVRHQFAEDPRYYNTAWTVAATRGILLALVIALSGWPVSIWYDAPVLIWLLPALGLSTMFTGFNSTAIPLLTRRLDPARVVTLNIVTAFIGAVVTVLWVACVSPNVWGFVVSAIASSLLLSILSHFLIPGHRNGLHWDQEAANELFQMSRWIMPSTIITFFTDMCDRLLIGRLSGLHDTGVYHIAAQLSGLPSQLLSTISGSLLLPLYSERVRSGAVGNERIVQRIRRLYVGAGTAMALGLLVFGPIAIRILFGGRFEESGWMAQVLAIGVVFRTMGESGVQYLRALGRDRSMMLANATKVPGMLLGAPLGFLLFGIPGLLAGFVIADALRYAAIAYTLRSAGIPGLRDDIAALSVVAATGVAVVVLS